MHVPLFCACAAYLSLEVGLMESWINRNWDEGKSCGLKILGEMVYRGAKIFWMGKDSPGHHDCISLSWILWTQIFPEPYSETWKTVSSFQNLIFYNIWQLGWWLNREQIKGSQIAIHFLNFAIRSFLQSGTFIIHAKRMLNKLKSCFIPCFKCLRVRC